jgi:hypothetical protein
MNNQEPTSNRMRLAFLIWESRKAQHVAGDTFPSLQETLDSLYGIPEEHLEALIADHESGTQVRYVW